MKLAAIHHVAIIVSDYEKSKDFYVNRENDENVTQNLAGPPPAVVCSEAIL